MTSTQVLNQSYQIKMVNYHAACDSTLSVIRGANLFMYSFPESRIAINFDSTHQKLGDEEKGFDEKKEEISNDKDKNPSSPVKEYNLIFSDRKLSLPFFSSLKMSQSINRLPFLDHLTLKMNLAKVLRDYDEDYLLKEKKNFYWGYWATSVAPRTFILPEQENLFTLMAQEEKEKEKTNATQTFPISSNSFYIMKPNNGSQGQGITIVENLSSVLTLFHQLQEQQEHQPEEGTQQRFDGNYVIQNYLNNPALYHGAKFDLRVYVVLVEDGCHQDDKFSYDRPIQGFLLRSGFARLCSTQYEPVTIDNKDVLTMHIANDGINFQGDVKMSDILRTTEHIFDYLVLNYPGITLDLLWSRLESLCSKVVVAFQHSIRKLHQKTPIPFLSNSQHCQCYQLLGFDVMLDDSCNMSLLEVNAKPCMDWEKEDVDQTVGPEVNTEVMGISLGFGLVAGKEGQYQDYLKSDLIRERTIPLKLTHPPVESE